LLKVAAGLCLALAMSACSSGSEAEPSATLNTSVAERPSTTTQPVVTTAAADTTPETVPKTTTTIGSGGDVQRVEGLTYRNESGDGDASTVDVFVPNGPEGRPGVVLLHGIDFDSDGVLESPLDAFAEEIAQFGATVFYFRWYTSAPGGIGWSSRSAADLSCIGSFVTAHAGEFGVDPDRLAVIGHSMGAPAGGNLAFRSFDVTADADCVATGPKPRAAAFVGIGGAYGWLARPDASDAETFVAAHVSCNTPNREVAASDAVAPGLTAQQGYELDGYSSLQQAETDLRVVLVVGSRDPWLCTRPSVTNEFAEAARTVGLNVEVVELEGRGHEEVVQPVTLGGSLTLDVIKDVLAAL
jgi:pimeloyl-ACP methyl ester carboxylesterase